MMSNQCNIYIISAEIQGTGAKVKCQFNKKLSCGKEAAICSVSLKILLSLNVTHSKLHR